MFIPPEKIGAPALLIGFTAGIILLFSSSFFSPIILILFSASCELVRGKKPIHQTALLFLASFLASFAVFFNPFFMRYFPLLLVSCLYFGTLIVLDCMVMCRLTAKPSFTLPLLFLYVVLSRTILSVIPFAFPFYWTLQIQLLPALNSASRFILPIFFEGIVMVTAAAVYLRLAKKTKKTAKYILPQICGILVVSIVLSLLIKNENLRKYPAQNLECGIIQGGYSAKDYTLMELYPAAKNEMTRRYLQHLEESPRSRLMILPESAFPIHQTQDSLITQTIKNVAAKRNAYIMTSMLLKENTEVYNAVALINPEGQIQDLYRKRNVMLFVESDDLKRGKDKTLFTVDTYTVAPLICFDAVFLNNYIQKKRPDVYIVTSNDVFAEGTVLSRLHQGYSVINARMVGIPLLQITQNGPSFYVDSKGTLTNLTRPYEQALGLQVIIP